MTRDFCEKLKDDVMTLEKYTVPMQKVVTEFANGDHSEFDAVVISSEFRITDREKNLRTANVRYLQTRDELLYSRT